jgi:hypothetical protein
MPLRDIQIKIVNYYEQWYHSKDDINEKVPDYEVMAKELNIKVADIFTWLRVNSTIEALDKRGISLPGDILGLTTEQLAVANILLDISDHRPQNKKLKELGISPLRYQGWMNQPKFQQYIRGRSEALLGNSIHEAHAALLQNVQRGDYQSLKFYYEMTGRWSSKTVGDLNVQFIMLKIIESIQRHVKDPDTIQAIANDLNELMPSPVGIHNSIALPLPETVPIRDINPAKEIVSGVAE